MIRLGKVHDGWMVDLRPSSRKLRLRALRLVQELARVGQARARGLLKASGGSVKLAVLMSAGLGLSQARERLSEAGGSLRRALPRYPEVL